MDNNQNPGLRINACSFCHSVNVLAQSMSADHFRNLESSIVIAFNSRVMLTTNEWTEVGLTNGAMGNVRDIIFKTNQGPPNMPKAIVGELDEDYKGLHLLKKRTQFPLVLIYALTVHNSQGMTLGSSDGSN
jgi:ATP-dependent DNA helicase PIF1